MRLVAMNTTNKDILRLINFLAPLQVYPEPTQEVKIIQTHASVVAVCDKFVYKFKKAVDFGFLDFSTFEKREHFCQEEVRLNSRLAEEVYIDVVYLYLDEAAGYSFKANGTPAEAAVKMHRLQEDKLLIHQIESPSFEYSKITLLANCLSQYYAQYPVEDERKHWGNAEHLLVSVQENFDQMQAFVGDSLSELAYNFLKTYQIDFLKNETQLFLQRIAEGKIKDCHGDVRAEHIYIDEEKVSIYDCIEFNERFRCIDQLNDLAFLTMDLTHRGRYDLAKYFLECILAQIETKSVSSLLNFYQSYRACVRGKVNAMKAHEQEIAPEQRQSTLLNSQAYFGLALRYALLGTEKTLLVILGGVASGKSTLAQLCATHFGLPHFNSDVIRKAQAGFPPHYRGTAAERAQLYSEAMTFNTYQNLLTAGFEGIEKHGAAVLDATFRSQYWLDQLQAQAKDRQTKLIVIRTSASEEIIKQRLLARAKKHNISDMRWEDYQTDVFSFQADLSGFQYLIEANTTLSKQDTLSQIFGNLYQYQF